MAQTANKNEELEAQVVAQVKGLFSSLAGKEVKLAELSQDKATLKAAGLDYDHLFPLVRKMAEFGVVKLTRGEPNKQAPKGRILTLKFPEGVPNEFDASKFVVARVRQKKAEPAKAAHKGSAAKAKKAKAPKAAKTALPEPAAKTNPDL